MDVIYMCYIVFVMSQMLYISLICCVCEYRIKKKLASLPSARQRNYEKNKKYLPSADLAGHSAKKLLKKIFAECLPGRALGKEILKKKLKNLCRAPLTWHSAKHVLTQPVP